MITRLTRYFFRGLVAGLPVVLSAYVLLWFFNLVDRGARGLFAWALPSVLEVPGVGILLGVLLLMLLGFLLSWPVLARVFALLELPFRNVPLVKSVYSAFKDLLDYFGQNAQADSQVVVVEPPSGQGLQFIGLLTRSNLSDLPAEVARRDDTVAVFVPMSYALGGYTVFVPRAWVRRTPMKVEVVMRSALTAWIKK
ncbi:MAG: DUF502 domain-containing protein [Bdellovibrionales bacterium]|nr:DUF502 domain-containing protein [Bdellovibrionales bacterium]